MKLPLHSAPTEWKGNHVLRCPYPLYNIPRFIEFQPHATLYPPTTGVQKRAQAVYESIDDSTNSAIFIYNILEMWGRERGLPIITSPGWETFQSLPAQRRGFAPPSFSPHFPSPKTGTPELGDSPLSDRQKSKRQLDIYPGPGREV